MKSFRDTYHEIRDSHKHTLKFLDSSISFIDISTIQKRMDKLGNKAYGKFLTDWEHSYVDDIKIPKRKLDFLAGRVAGKRAVRRHLIKNNGKRYANSLQFNDIEIKRTVTGRPMVFIKDGSSRNGSSDYMVSISHTEGVAASLVCDKNICKGIGIDIEKIEKRHNALLDVAFNESEIKLFREYVKDEKDKVEERFVEEVSRGWAVKEAVMKSMGVGVNIDLKDIEIINFGPYEAVVKLTSGALDRFNLLEGNEIQVEAGKIEKFMVSIACLY